MRTAYQPRQVLTLSVQHHPNKILSWIDFLRVLWTDRLLDTVDCCNRLQPASESGSSVLGCCASVLNILARGSSGMFRTCPQCTRGISRCWSETASKTPMTKSTTALSRSPAEISELPVTLPTLFAAAVAASKSRPATWVRSPEDQQRSGEEYHRLWASDHCRLSSPASGRSDQR